MDDTISAPNGQQTAMPASAQAIIQTLQREIAKRDGIIADLHARNRQRAQFIAWENRLFGNSNYEASYKLLVRNTAFISQVSNTDEPVISREELARKQGQGVTSISRLSGKLTKDGNLIKRLVPIRLPNGDPVLLPNGKVKKMNAYALPGHVQKAPETMAPPTPINRGGARYPCPEHSDTELKIRHRHITDGYCPKCDKWYTIRDDLTREPPENEQGINASPDVARMFQVETQENDNQTLPPTREGTFQVEIPAKSPDELLRRWFGSDEYPIAMTGKPGKKYRPKKLDRKGNAAKHIITRSDRQAHLDGDITLGSGLAYVDGTCYAIEFDCDGADELQRGRDAQQALALKGIHAVIVETPEGAQPHKEKPGQSGRLAVVFDGRVSIEAARALILDIAPGLTPLEMFPNVELDEKGHVVKIIRRARPSLGKYRAAWKDKEGKLHTVNAWPRMITATGEVALDGHAQAALLVPLQNPAKAIPPLPDGYVSPIRVAAKEKAQRAQARTSGDERPANIPDERWHQENDGKKFWIQVMPAYAAWHYRQRHPLTAVLEPGGNGKFFSPHREEGDASVNLSKDGRICSDWGADELQPDGKQWWGDSLDVYARQEGIDGAEALRRETSMIVLHASKELMAAADAGEDIPTWLIEHNLVTPLGKAVHAERQQKARQRGGVFGYQKV